MVASERTGADVSGPVATIEFKGEVEVRPYRRGTYLGHDHLETLVERSLGGLYRFGTGWRGYGVVSISLFAEELGAGERGGS